MFHVFRKRCGRFGNRVWLDWLYTEFHELKESIPRKSWQNISSGGGLLVSHPFAVSRVDVYGGEGGDVPEPDGLVVSTSGQSLSQQ